MIPNLPIPKFIKPLNCIHLHPQQYSSLLKVILFPKESKISYASYIILWDVRLKLTKTCCGSQVCDVYRLAALFSAAKVKSLWIIHFKEGFTVIWPELKYIHIKLYPRQKCLWDATFHPVCGLLTPIQEIEAPDLDGTSWEWDYKSLVGLKLSRPSSPAQRHNNTCTSPHTPANTCETADGGAFSCTHTAQTSFCGAFNSCPFTKV